MPTTRVNGTEYAYEEEGEGPLLLFGHDLLAGRETFAPQVAALCSRFRCVSLDWPGHGDSGFRAAGWTLEDLADDVALLVRALGEERAGLVGNGLGGMVFMRVALAHPEVVGALILLGTSARAEDAEARAEYEPLHALLRAGTQEERGQAAGIVQHLLHGGRFLREQPDAVVRGRELVLNHDREGAHLAAQAMFGREDITPRLPEIASPTLVIVGEADVATPPDRAREIVAAIRDAELVVIPGAGHLTPVEAPEAVTEAIEAFLEQFQLPPAD